MKLISLFFAVFFSVISSAQNISCPPNIDFEQGNLSNWQFFTGSCCPINAINLTPAILNRHTLTSGMATDAYGGFPIVATGGGSYSLKLGNTSTGAQSEKARYTFTVPIGLNNYSLVYKYAVVFQDPAHSPADQPRFEVKVFNALTNETLPCATYSYIAAANIPGFLTSPINGSVRYKSWSTASIDLSGYAGQTLAVEFASGDCAAGAHFGYGYVDLSCGLFQILSVTCNNNPLTNLSAPPGFDQYLWYDSTYANLIDTGMNITINTPPANTQYNLVILPYIGFGCPDTLHTLVTVSNFSLTVSNDTTLCQHDSVQLNALANGNGSPFTYTWTPNNNINCTNCANPKVNATTTQSYFVTATDNYGCSKTDSVLLNVKPISLYNINQSICSQDTFLGYYTTGVYKDTFMNVIGCDSIRTLNLTVSPVTSSVSNIMICAPDTYEGYSASGVFIDTFTNATGCDSIRTLNLTVIPIKYSNIVYTICEPDAYLGYNTTGTYIDTLIAVSGCDSIRTLNLTVNPITNNTINSTICAPDSFLGYSETGIYLDTFINAKGCDSIRTLNLFVNVPTFSSFSKNICIGENYLGYTQSGIYTDVFTNAKGCDSIRQLNLYVDEIKFGIDIKDINCVGETSGSIRAQILNCTEQNKYVLVPGYLVNTFGTFTGLGEGVYTLSVTDSFGCKKDTILSVGLISQPMFLQFTKQDLSCNGTGHEGWVEVDITGGVAPFSYLWNTSPVQISRRIENLSFGYYPVFIIDAYGCKVNDSVYIEPGNCCEEVFIPNAFSPNNDGLNDVFKVTTTAGVDLIQWAVYNRWGKLLWDSRDYFAGWDGTYLGEKQPLGTYFYVFRYKCTSDGKYYFKKGDVTILR